MRHQPRVSAPSHGLPSHVLRFATLGLRAQALISAMFQIVSQAIKQGFLPRFAILHTSRTHAGQLYIPVMNWLLMALCIIVVAAFQTSARIGRAYGAYWWLLRCRQVNGLLVDADATCAAWSCAG